MSNAKQRAAHRFVTESDEAWMLVDDQFDPSKVSHFETLFTLANGYCGVRGSIEISPHLGNPGFYIAGVYDHIEEFTHEIVNLPCFLAIEADLDGFGIDLQKGEVLEYRRALDMRQGLLFTTILWMNEIKQIFRWESVRLVHQVEKHVSLISGQITALTSGGNLTIRTSLDSWAVKHSSCSGATRYAEPTTYDLGGIGIGLDVTTKATGIRVAEATSISIPGASHRSVSLDDDRVSESYSVPLAVNRPVRFEKRTVVYTSRDTDDPVSAARTELARLAEISSQKLISSHTRAWDKLWQDSDIAIEGDEQAQKAIRFNTFHLLSIANPGDNRVSLGAKGLHGNGYNGLIFWDTEIYMLPPLLYTDPAAARALLEYRHHFLPDAMQNARDLGRKGAFYPWNSSLTGREGPNPGWQEHVGSDIAYAVDQYVQSTGDTEFFLNYGAELIIATALYWPSRVESDPEKGYILKNLTGSDEIHGCIDNNTFTNHLVKWHLDRAVRTAKELQEAGLWENIAARYDIRDDDIERWAEIAERIYINYSARRGFHEQFDGFFGLKERAIDRSMTQKQYTGPVLHSFRPTKVSKQADTVLMYYLFPNDFPLSMVKKAYEFYEPRCSHTSTLSRSIHAAVAARVGLTDDAYRQFILSAETDTGPTAECDSGIHAACLGGNWQAVVMGFGGFSIQEGKPSFNPKLPEHWDRLAFRLKWRGKTISVDARLDGLRLSSRGGAVTVMVAGQEHRIASKETYLPSTSSHGK